MNRLLKLCALAAIQCKDLSSPSFGDFSYTGEDNHILLTYFKHPCSYGTEFSSKCITDNTTKAEKFIKKRLKDPAAEITNNTVLKLLGLLELAILENQDKSVESYWRIDYSCYLKNLVLIYMKGQFIWPSKDAEILSIENSKGIHLAIKFLEERLNVLKS